MTHAPSLVQSTGLTPTTRVHFLLGTRNLAGFPAAADDDGPLSLHHVLALPQGWLWSGNFLLEQGLLQLTPMGIKACHRWEFAFRFLSFLSTTTSDFTYLEHSSHTIQDILTCSDRLTLITPASKTFTTSWPPQYLVITAAMPDRKRLYPSQCQPKPLQPTAIQFPKWQCHHQSSPKPAQSTAVADLAAHSVMSASTQRIAAGEDLLAMQLILMSMTSCPPD